MRDGMRNSIAGMSGYWITASERFFGQIVNFAFYVKNGLHFFLAALIIKEILSFGGRTNEFYGKDAPAGRRCLDDCG